MRTLQLLVDGPHAKPYRAIFLPVIDSLRTGDTLGEALRTQSKYLPVLFIETVVAGELSGKLDVVLDDLTRHYDEMLSLQRLYIRGAMYPLMLILTGVVIIPFVRGFVFSPDTLEVYTVKFLWQLLRHYGPLFLVVWILARAGVLRRITNPLFSRVWPIAGFWKRFALARFCRCMGIMLGAGMGVRQSIERSAAVTTHPKLKEELRTAVPLVQQGHTLEEALRATLALPEMVQEMVRTGEVSGNDEALFYKAAEYLYNEAKYPAHTIGIGLTSYLILAFFLLFVAGIVLGSLWSQILLAIQSVWESLFAG